MTEDPWSGISPPSNIDSMTAYRVSAELPWNFFWGRDLKGRYLLILRHASESSLGARLPRLSDIDISIATADADNIRNLIFTLQESTHRDIFYRLCLDIIGAATPEKTEEGAVSSTLAQTWRWQRLLRGGDGRLSPEEQKGLIGEFLVFDRLLLPELSGFDSISSWKGPLGAPQDFVINNIAIEAKAHRGSANPYIAISSERQLDFSGVDALFLQVVELDEASSNAPGSYTVVEAAERVRSRLRTMDEGAVEGFNSLLLTAGLVPTDDYSEFQWLEGKLSLYQVTAGFPRITSGEISEGVGSVRYSVDLNQCGPYLSDTATFVMALKGGQNAS